jgi:predicted O-linked N-acetylglucosamine transferase (SPINDLY family)
LRVAYLSADYHLHATSHLVAELFESHDRTRVEAFAYSTGPADDSAVRARIIAGAYRFREFSSPYADAIVNTALADNIDILIDFNGHTIGGRFDVFARKPAPIQAAWLVFPGTVGGDAIDYLIADAFVAPPEHASAYAERLVYLPHCYQINDRQRAHPPAPPRERCELPDDAFVFACFNNTQKIAPGMFAIWMRLLTAISDSVLWLLTSNPATQQNLRDAARGQGVAPERIVFAPPKSVPAHLARVQLADLFLDTLPYNAHTTASDALWMGVPLVTCVGDTFPSRVAGSLLRAVGMSELITDSLADYEALALALARDRARLRELRARLESSRATCALFDTPRFVRGLERAYRMMWDRYAGGLPPAPLVVEDLQ